MHKNASEAALETSNGDAEDLEDYLREVQSFHKIYCSHAFLHRDIPTLEMERLKALQEIPQYEILARYGDSLGQEVQDFRMSVYAKRVDEDEEEQMSMVPPKFSNEWLWTEIAESMKMDKRR